MAPIDPATVVGAAKAAGTAAKGIQALMETAGKVNETLKRESRIESEEVTLDCGVGLAVYSVVIGVKPGVSRWVNRTIRFPLPNIVRFEVRSLGTFALETQAVHRTADGGWEVFTPALSDADRFVVKVEYTVDGNGFLDALVHRNHDRDPRVTGSQEEYWMAAQFRHLDVLKNKYGRIDLRDIDFRVDVAVNQALKTAVPRSFVRELEVISSMIREKERGKKIRLAFEHLRTRNQGATGREAEILADIQAVFTVSKFQRFVEVKDEFRYADLQRGAKAYTQIPFASLPEHMTVVSKTDLSLSKPAANGKLIYRKAEFEKTIQELFPDTMRRLNESDSDTDS